MGGFLPNRDGDGEFLFFSRGMGVVAVSRLALARAAVCLSRNWFRVQGGFNFFSSEERLSSRAPIYFFPNCFRVI